MSDEIQIDIEHAWRFAAGGTVASNRLFPPPGQTSSVTATVSPSLAPFNLGNTYVASFTPDVAGQWLFVAYDAGDATLYSAEFDCVAYPTQTRLRYISGTTAGKCSGAGSGTETYYDLDGTTAVIEATVDSDGNRTAMSYDPT